MSLALVGAASAGFRQRCMMVAMAGLAVLLMAWQWPAGAEEPAMLERVPLEIQAGDKHHRLEVELARTAAERMRGLMERDYLAADAGMLFVYQTPQPADGGFWMYRTRIPLDIAFIGVDGRIANIETMQPCLSDDPQQCPVTLAGVRYTAALEVNAGYFEERGIEKGACVSWSGRQYDCD